MIQITRLPGITQGYLNYQSKRFGGQFQPVYCHYTERISWVKYLYQIIPHDLFLWFWFSYHLKQKPLYDKVRTQGNDRSKKTSVWNCRKPIHWNIIQHVYCDHMIDKALYLYAAATCAHSSDDILMSALSYGNNEVWLVNWKKLRVVKWYHHEC